MLNFPVEVSIVIDILMRLDNLNLESFIEQQRNPEAMKEAKEAIGEDWVNGLAELMEALLVVKRKWEHLDTLLNKQQTGTAVVQIEAGAKSICSSCGRDIVWTGTLWDHFEPKPRHQGTPIVNRINFK